MAVQNLLNISVYVMEGGVLNSKLRTIFYRAKFGFFCVDPLILCVYIRLYTHVSTIVNLNFNQKFECERLFSSLFYRFTTQSGILSFN